MTSTTAELRLLPPLHEVVLPDGPRLLSEHGAFEAALAVAGDRLRRYVRRRLPDHHECEEIVQEALARACQHRHRLTDEEDLLAWTTVVAGRLVIDRVRSRVRTTPHAEVPAPRPARDTADLVVARENARTALDVLEDMPSRQAAVLWAREVEGMSYDDISVRYGLSEPTVRSLLHRARRTLRREYTARGGGLPGAAFGVAAPVELAGRVFALIRTVAPVAAASTAASAVLGMAAVAGLTARPHPAPAVARPVVGAAAAPAAAAPTTLLRRYHPRPAVAPAGPVTSRPAVPLTKHVSTTAPCTVSCAAPSAPATRSALPAALPALPVLPVAPLVTAVRAVGCQVGVGLICTPAPVLAPVVSLAPVAPVATLVSVLGLNAGTGAGSL